MKICVNLRDPAPANLRSGNLRSEPRWERQALEASFSNPQVTAVYSTGRTWSGNHPKYKGRMTANGAADTVLLLQDWNTSVVNAFNYRAAIVNVFSGPWDHQMGEVKAAYRKLGGNLFFTMGFPIMHRHELGLKAPSPASTATGPGTTRIDESGDTVVTEPRRAESHLEKFLPRENILCLPVPGSPGVVPGSNFDKPNLMWAQRLIFMSQMAKSASLLWAIQQVDKTPGLTLDVLTGWKAAEVKDYVNEQVVKRPNIVNAFWQLEEFQPFAHLKGRVKVHLELDWERVVVMYSQTKILVTYGRAFGGPPIEAGMHGVPFIAAGETGALCDCPGYLHIGSEERCLPILDNLFNNREFYDKTGNAYRDYVNETYTYSAFNNNVNKLLKDKGVF